MSLKPNNEAELSNPKKSIYYHIVESQDNINLRHFESDLSLYFPGTPAKTLLRYAGSEFNEGTIYDFSHEDQLKYNDNYSEVNDIRTAFPLALRETKQSDFPTRTHRSAKADPTSLIDNWRLFLANEFKDLPKNRGELWKLATFNNLLYFHMEDSLFAAKGKQQMQMKDGSEAFVGSGDIFQQEPDELIQTKAGYGGTQNQFAGLTTRNGYFFVDRANRKVFLMQDKLVEISKSGLENWFRDNLTYELEQYGLTSNCIPDNPLINFGLHSAWDPKYKRIILTKRERIPTKTFKTMYSMYLSGGTGDKVRFNASICKFEYELASSAGIWRMIDWDDTTYFMPGGWTISYFPELAIWISLHGYVPYLYFSTSTDFYSITDEYINYINGQLSSDGVIAYQDLYGYTLGTLYGNAAIWRHNGPFKGILYKDHKISDEIPQYSEFEFIHNESKNLDQVFYNISYTLQCFKYNSDSEKHDINILNHGFTDYHIYNTHQVFTTTETPYQSFAQPLEYFVNIRRIGNAWKINGFRDYAALAVQSTPGGYYMSTNTNIIGGINVGTLTTAHDELMYLVNTTGPYYVEELNTNYLDMAKTWDQQRKFIDKWAGIRLIYNNIENNLLNLYSTEVGSRKYYR